MKKAILSLVDFLKNQHATIFSEIMHTKRYIEITQNTISHTTNIANV